MRKIILLVALCFALVGSVYAQQTVTGTVTDEEGLGIPGVSIIEEGTSNGTITQGDGTFRITVKSGNATLQFSFVGLTTVTETVNGRTKINVTLLPDTETVDEVVVTALGIKRDKKSLGYAISTIKADELTIAGNSQNPVLALYGKASGVGIQSGSAGPTGGINIKIRGAAGLETSSNTRPLFVVDGVPIHDEGSNMASRGYDPLNSFDYGSGINDINPEDIESMEILKGAKATVLYGSEGANGVVLITTKKGRQTRGLGVNVSYQKTWEVPHSYINFQNEFGSGTNEYDVNYTTLNGQEVREINKTRFNFGPKFDGEPIMFLDSIVRPYQAYPDNYIDLFRTGMTDNYTVAISGGNENGNMRVSYTRFDYDGLWDREYQKKDVLSFSGQTFVSDFANFEVNSNLYNIKTHNRRPNIQSIVAWGINRDYPFDAITDMYKNEDGSKFTQEGSDWPGQFSPVYLMDVLWEQYENSDTDEKFHYIGSVRTTLNFTDNIYFVGQAGIDYTDTEFTTRNAITQYSPSIQGGKYSYNRDKVVVQNYRGFLNYEESFMNDRMRLLAFVGGEYKSTEFKNVGVSSYGNFLYPDFWSIDNTNDWPAFGSRGRVRSHTYGSKVLYSALGSATLSWKDELYVELQARNDWSSTLPPDNNSYFYPGVGVSWNFTNSVDIPYMEFGKFRASWADVGIDAPGYYYAYRSYSVGTVNNTNATTISTPSSLFAGDLKPERKREFEIGFDGRFFKRSRLETSISWYTYNRYDQIMAVDLSRVTGAGDIKINAGHVKNNGLEVMLKGAPIATEKFRWDLTLTGAFQKTKVKELYPGITSKTVHSIGSSVLAVAEENEPFGEILMYDYLTDGSGNRIINDNGYYVLDKSEMKKAGNIQDNFYGGLTSNFSFKGFNLNALIDYKFGGSIFSYSNYYLLGMGISEETLKYRNEEHGGMAYYVDDATGNRIEWQHDQGAPAGARDGRVYHDGLILDGVRNEGTEDNPNYVPNDVILSATEYYSSYIHDMSEDFQPDQLYKNNYIKLRQVALSYTIPKKLANSMHLQKLTLSLIARNPFYIYKSIPNVDAESTLGTNSIVEYSFYPSIKSYGFGVNVSF
ncbi:MAG: SusC/RagA family TonB-linked outer membrane protein [Draconibacterium sp.]